MVRTEKINISRTMHFIALFFIKKNMRALRLKLDIEQASNEVGNSDFK